MQKVKEVKHLVGIFFYVKLEHFSSFFLLASFRKWEGLLLLNLKTSKTFVSSITLIHASSVVIIVVVIGIT